MADRNFENRTLYHGDNLDFLRGMNSGTVNLIATDPPFNKSRDFHATPDSLAAGASFQDRWSWQDDIHDEWLVRIQRDEPEVWHVITAAKEVYGDDMAAFLCWLGVRLLEMHRILTDDGSVYLHIDDTAHAWAKALMDAVFGAHAYRNTLAWRRATSHNDASNYGRIMDYLLFYSKGPTHTWNGENVVAVKTSEELQRAYPSEDDRGRFRADNLTGPRHNTQQGSPSAKAWHGYDVFAMGRVWSVPKTGKYAEYIERHFIPGYRAIEGVHDRLNALDAAGLIYHPQKGKWAGLKRYADADTGNPAQNLILEPTGFTNFTAGRGEATGYPTQKPLALYERFVLASSNPGDMVLDPFCGCATTPVAAERHGRQWVGMDIWDGAHQLVLDRMEAEGLAVKNRRDRRGQGALMTFGDIRYETEPPARTDSGETATLTLRTPTGRALQYPHPRTQHGRLLADIGAFCQGCGADYTFDPRVLEVDHINPRSQGGTDAYENLTLLCPPCNKEKRDRYTLIGLQQVNRANGWMKNENNLRMGRAVGRTGRRRRR